MDTIPQITAYKASDYTIRIMLSVSVVKVRRSFLRISRARRRQERSSLREGTTPPLRRSLRTSRVLRFSSINMRVPLLQSSPGTSPRRPLPPLLSPYQKKVVCKAGKCRHEHRHQDSKSISRFQPLCDASILPPYAPAGAGSLSLRKPAVGTSPPARLLRSASR